MDYVLDFTFKLVDDLRCLIAKFFSKFVEFLRLRIVIVKRKKCKVDQKCIVCEMNDDYEIISKEVEQYTM